MHAKGALPERLKAARESLGLTQKAMGEGVGSTYRSWQDYERGQKVPGSQVIAGMVKLGINANWVLSGEGQMLLSKEYDWSKCPPALDFGDKDRKDEVKEEPKEPGDDYALIPLYDVRAAAGHGAVVEHEEVIDSLAFKRQWVRQELGVSPSDLYLIHVDGESMEPTLRPGDVILVDRRSAEAVPRDGIYVLRMDGSLLVKRMQRLPHRKVRVTSDNPAYDPFELDLEHPDDDLAIIGRVVWAGRRM